MHGIQLRQTDEADRIDELANPSNETADPISAPATKANRQTTDLAVYKYYFSALGWVRISALLLFLITEAGMSGFRCKLQLYFQVIDETAWDLHCYRRMNRTLVFKW